MPDLKFIFSFFQLFQRQPDARYILVDLIYIVLIQKRVTQFPPLVYMLLYFCFIIKQMSQNNCQLRNSKEKGEGLYALKQFKRGDVVYTCQVDKFDCPNDSHTSQVDMEKWVLFTLLGRSINHSCDPNCGVGFDGANWVYKAFKDIKQGDQLTYDYAMANYKVENFPNCLCKSGVCRRQIKGYQNLPVDRKREYKGFMAPYLEKKLEEQQEVQ